MTPELEYLPVLPSEVRVLGDDESCPELPIIDEGGRAWAVAWPGVGAHLRSMHRISLASGGTTLRLSHPMEAVYYVIGGSAQVVDHAESAESQLSHGAMILVDPGTPYSFRAGPEGAEIVGGPCPPDPGMYVHLPEG